MIRKIERYQVQCNTCKKYLASTSGVKMEFRSWDEAKKELLAKRWLYSNTGIVMCDLCAEVPGQT